MNLKKRIIYFEPLTEAEKAYLSASAHSSKKGFMKTVHYMFLVLAIIMIFVYTIANFTYDPHNIDPNTTTPLTPEFVLLLAGIMFLTFGVLLSIAYVVTIHKYFREIKKGQKIVESTTVKEKRYMPQNNKYYLYLNSPTKGSIEVEPKMYAYIQVNDEINIEYTPFSKSFLGYY